MSIDDVNVKTTAYSVRGHGYGFCPVCGAQGRDRERRPNGNDTCENGHVYPSRSARSSPPSDLPCARCAVLTTENLVLRSRLAELETSRRKEAENRGKAAEAEGEATEAPRTVDPPPPPGWRPD